MNGAEDEFVNVGYRVTVLPHVQLMLPPRLVVKVMYMVEE